MHTVLSSLSHSSVRRLIQINEPTQVSELPISIVYKNEAFPYQSLPLYFWSSWLLALIASQELLA